MSTKEQPVSNHLPSLLDKVRGEGLCISLLLDPRRRHWIEDSVSSTATPKQPPVCSLKATTLAFKESLKLSQEKIRKIERDTKDQQHSTLWFSVQRYRITGSLFGHVLCRQETTSPDSLVLRILEQKQFSSAATEWGLKHEPLAIQQYIDYQRACGNNHLMVSPSVCLVSESHPYLGASPDGAVYDPLDVQQPFGFLEVKCPHTQRNVMPVDACLAFTWRVCFSKPPLGGFGGMPP